MKTRLMMFVAVIALFVFNGCSDSKESYVKDFKKFIEKVEAAGSDYTEEDWKKADEKFETFTGDRYEKFSSELTIDEQIEITKLKATYATRRGLSNLKNGVDKLLDSDILKMEKNKNRYQIIWTERVQNSFEDSNTKKKYTAIIETGFIPVKTKKMMTENPFGFVITDLVISEMK